MVGLVQADVRRAREIFQSEGPSSMYAYLAEEYAWLIF